MKNYIYISIIIIGLSSVVLAILWRRHGSREGIELISEAEQTWVICLSGQCGKSWQMGLKEFCTKQMKAAEASFSGTAVIDCPHCGKKSVVEAFKCEKCGKVSPKGIVPGDVSDRCPHCKHSASEVKRRAGG